MMRIKKISLVERVLTHGILGSIAGVLVLHPLSMVIHDVIELNKIRLITLQMMFSVEHIIMAGYLTVLGCIFGMFRALYIHKREQLYENIKLLSLTDELTSIYNRRYFDAQLKKEIDRARRYFRSLSLLIVDLNDFKKYNDTFGHQQGDFLLKGIALLLKNNLRGPDFVARYGGDEFVIVMPETDKDDAIRLSERLHSEIERCSFNKTGTVKGEEISVSIGVATFPADSGDVDGLFSIADEQMYIMKRKKEFANII